MLGDHYSVIGHNVLKAKSEPGLKPRFRLAKCHLIPPCVLRGDYGHARVTHHILISHHLLSPFTQINISIEKLSKNGINSGAGSTHKYIITSAFHYPCLRLVLYLNTYT